MNHPAALFGMTLRATEEAMRASAGGTSPLFGRQEALAMIGGDEDLLLDVVAVAREELPKQLIALRTALAASDAVTARRHAHTMKGTVATLCAAPVRDRAFTIEHAAKEGNLDRAREELDPLAQLVERLLDELHRL